MVIGFKRANILYCLVLFVVCCLVFTNIDVLLAPLYTRFVISWTCEGCFVRAYTFSIQPSQLCQNEYGRHVDIDALYLMPSRAGDTERRALIRRTTLSFTQLNSRHSQFRHLFIIGASPTETTQRLIEQESRKFGDILQQNFVDTYDNLTLKTLAGLEWALQNCWNAKWLVKVDDDVFFKWERLVKLQKQLEHSKSNYVIGHCFYRMFPIRYTNLPDLDKIVIDEDTYPYRYFAPYCSGPLYMLSQEVAKEIVNVSVNTPYFKLEDAYLGLCLLQTNYTTYDIPDFLVIYGDVRGSDICELSEEYIVVHELSPKQIEDSWTRCIAWSCCCVHDTESESCHDANFVVTGDGQVGIMATFDFQCNISLATCLLKADIKDIILCNYLYRTNFIGCENLLMIDTYFEHTSSHVQSNIFFLQYFNVSRVFPAQPNQITYNA